MHAWVVEKFMETLQQWIVQWLRSAWMGAEGAHVSFEEIGRAFVMLTQEKLHKRFHGQQSTTYCQRSRLELLAKVPQSSSVLLARGTTGAHRDPPSGWTLTRSCLFFTGPVCVHWCPVQPRVPNEEYTHERIEVRALFSGKLCW